MRGSRSGRLGAPINLPLRGPTRYHKRSRSHRFSTRSEVVTVEGVGRLYHRAREVEVEVEERERSSSSLVTSSLLSDRFKRSVVMEDREVRRSYKVAREVGVVRAALS